MARSSRRTFGRPAKGRRAASRTGGRSSWSDHTDLMMPLPADYYAEPRRVPVSRLLRAAGRTYLGWVRQSPDTRGLGTGLAALYPVGQLAHQYAASDALLLGAFAPPAALAAWVATYKRHESVRYSATLAATAAGIPAWLATAAHTGITNLPTLLAYTATATVTWSAYTWSDVLQHRRAMEAMQAKWETLSAATDLAGSRLLKTEPTHVGVRFKVDVGADGPAVSRLISGGLAEEVARLYGIGVDQVRLTGQHSNARILWITLQLRDPWTEKVPHPALATSDAIADAAATTAPASAGKGCRSITDGPFVLGTVPETGEDLAVWVYDDGGARHVDIFAGTGGGKSVLLSNFVEQVSECFDALPLAIDLGKGTIPHLWHEVLDADAGIGERHKALQILQWVDTVIEERSLASGGRNHVPTPQAPILFLFVDEMDTLTGMTSEIAHEAKPYLDNIHRRGRSAGVVLVRAGQRNVVQHTGTKEGQANATTTIVLRLRSSKEMGRTIEEWQTLGLPDMSTYAPGVKGVALVIGDGGTWDVGRVRDLSDFDAVRALSAARGRSNAQIEPDIAAKLPGYAQRHLVTTAARPSSPSGGAEPPFTDPPAGDPPAAHSLSPDMPRPSAPAADATPQPPREGDGSFGIDPADDQAVTRAADGLTAEIEKHLQNMPEPPSAPTPLDDLVANKKALDDTTVPAFVSKAVLAFLAARDGQGARRSELVEHLGKPTPTVSRWLSKLCEKRVIMRVGQGKAARYHLPDTSPEDHTP
ncbi:hypothetical protein [Actinomadura hibisca]|uniref:hypothetical protein n=1 Tax=Actinomadura hibisca TaxID=68565 RepID=UPI000836D39E|nr:hypothetical protein [Actinomadura hibisca]